MASFLSVDRWKNTVKMKPDDSYCRLYLGLSYLNINSIGEAYKQLEKAVRLDPYNAAAHFVLGIVYALGGELKFAVKEWEKAVTVDPNVYYKLIAKPEIRSVIERNLDEALKKFKREIDINPQNIEAYLNMGKALLYLNKPEAALQYFRRVTELKIDFWEAYMYIGIAYQKMNQYQLAVTNLKRAITVNPKFPEGYYTLGEVYLSLGNPALAMRSFEKAVELDPGNARYLSALGRALQLSGNNLAAIRAFQKAIELNPRSKWPHFYLAQALEAEYQFELALQEYQKALELDPHFEEVYSYIGKLAKNMGLLKESLEYLEKAVKANPSDYEILYELANTYQMLDMKREAINTYERVISLNPNVFHVWLNLGNLYLSENDHERALEAYQKALSINPRFVDIYVSVGNIHMSRGEYKDALENFKKAVTLNPSLRTVYLNMAECYAKLGNYTEALEALNLYISKTGETKELLLKKLEIFKELGNDEGMLEIYIKLIEDYKVDEPDIILNAVNLMLTLGSNLERAYDFARRLVNLTTSREALLTLLKVSYKLGKTAEVLDQLELLGKDLLKIAQKEEISEEEYKLLQDNVWILDELGKLYFNRGELLKAQELYKKLKELTEKPEYCIRLAEIYYKQGFFTEALSSVKSALGQLPNSREAYQLIVKIYDKLGLYGEVVKYGQEFADKFGLNEEIGLLLVNALKKEHRYQEAEEVIKKLLDRPTPKVLVTYASMIPDPDKAQELIKRALDLVRRGYNEGLIEESEYISLFESALDTALSKGLVSLMEELVNEYITLPGFKHEVILQISSELEKMNELELALDILERSAGKLKELNRLDEWQEIDSEHRRLAFELEDERKREEWLRTSEPRFAEAYKLIKDGLLREAESVITSLKDRYADNPKLYFLEGSLAKGKLIYEDAAFYLMLASEKAMEEGDVMGHSLISGLLTKLEPFVDLAKIKERVQDYLSKQRAKERIREELVKASEQDVEISSGLKRSIRTLEKVAEELIEEQSPGEVEELFIRGVNAYEAFEYELAEQYLQDYLKFSPDDKRALMYLARTYYQLEDFQAVKSIYSKLSYRDMEPDDWFYYIDSLINMDQIDEAEKFVESFEERSAESDSVKAIVLARKGDLKRAVSLVKRAIKKQPNLWLNFYGLAVISFKLKKYDKALEYLKTARKQQPSNYRILSDIIQLMVLEGRHKDALVLAHKALFLVRPSYKARGLLIKTLLMLGEIDKAEEELKRLEAQSEIPARFLANLRKVFER